MSSDLELGRVVKAKTRRVKYWILAHPFAGAILASLALAGVYFLLKGFGLPAAPTGIFVDAVFSGILASLLTYSLIQFIFLQGRSRGVREWLGFGPRRAWIIPTLLEHPPTRPPSTLKYYVVPPFDAQATGFLTNTLRLAGFHYPLRQTVGSYRWDTRMLEDNIVTFCLPERNQYSRIFLGLLSELCSESRSSWSEIVNLDNAMAYKEDKNLERRYFGLKFEPDTREWSIANFVAPGETHRSTINTEPGVDHNQPNKVNYDYCLIVKCPNPFNLNAQILVICGIHGIGTFGGALWIHSQRHELYRDYSGSAQCHVLQVSYRLEAGADNYIDATIDNPRHIFPERPFEGARDFPLARYQARIS